MEKYPEAIISCRSAIAILERENEPMDLALAFMHLGDVFREIEAFDSANHYCQKALQLSLSLNDENMVSSVLEDLGNLSARMNLYERALDYHKQSLEIIERATEPEIRHLAISLIKVGQDYLNLNEHLSATEYLERGLKLSQEVGMKPEVAKAYQGLMDVKAAGGDFKSAFNYHQLYSAVKKRIFDEEKIKQVNELETKYQTAQKDQEINLLTKENEVQEAKVQGQSTLRNALIGGLISLAIIAALIFYSMRQKLKNQKIFASKNEEVKSANFKQQLGALENKALRSQMNPHFIFNCMNSINRMILSKDLDGASLYLTKFAKLIRLMLENSEKPTVPLEKELALVASYIQLESLTNNGKISYRINVDPEIDQEAIHIPSMVLQPFIENAIWHGLMNKKEHEGHIKIIIRESIDLLKCMIEDNGIGREKALELKKKAVLKSRSMGLTITQKRLQLLSKKELRNMIRFTDLKGPTDLPIGTRVDVLIPIS